MTVNADNFNNIKGKLPATVKLIAISKTRTPEQIMELYNCGHRLFGENKVQELLSKQDALPEHIEWHMVGHLQSNKVKYIAPFIGMIHSVDSLKILKIINKEGKKNNRVIPCLLQLHIAEEETKFGLAFEEAIELLSSDAYKGMHHVAIHGLMGMATFTEDTARVQHEFRFLKTCFDKIKESFFENDSSFCEISMGMSDDYPTAIAEGSTMVRIGSALFGERQY